VIAFYPERQRRSRRTNPFRAADYLSQPRPVLGTTPPRSAESAAFYVPMQINRKVQVKKVLVAVRREVATKPPIMMICKLFLVAVIGLVVVAGHAQAQTSKKQIVGTWSVVSVVNTVDGKQIDLYGPNPQGQTIFTRDGHFSTNIMRPGRAKFASNNRTAGTADENKEAMAGYIANFGTYAIAADGTLTLHIVGCSFPNWDGAEQKRRITIKGDELKWENATPSTGSGSVVIIMKRAK
jgi:hypothetical protein